MSKRKKLFDRIKNNPNDVSFSDIERLLRYEEFILDRITGSHHVFKKDSVIFVIPVHSNRVKSVYVKRVIELIEQLRTDE